MDIRKLVKGCPNAGRSKPEVRHAAGRRCPLFECAGSSTDRRTKLPEDRLTEEQSCLNIKVQKIDIDHVPWEKPKSYVTDEVDAFKLYKADGGIPHKLKNIQEERLIAQPKKFSAMFEPDKDDEVEQEIFYLHRYSTTSYINGLPVAISCKIGENNYVLKAEGDLVEVKEEELPKYILENTSQLIFYLRTFGHLHYCFESSLKRGFCLAWNINDSEKRLILKLPCDKIDETTAFELVKKSDDTY